MFQVFTGIRGQLCTRADLDACISRQPEVAVKDGARKPQMWRRKARRNFTLFSADEDAKAGSQRKLLNETGRF